MATVMNDRDVLLLGISQRDVNSQDATILITSDSPTFHVSATGTTTPSYITVTAHLLNIIGTASFTATGATITDNGNNTATVAYNGMPGSTATITASVTRNGTTYTASTTLSKVVDGSAGQSGSSASWVEISTFGGQVFSRTTATSAFSPSSIILNATPYGNNATDYQWQYWTGSTWSNISGATSATYEVASGDFSSSRNFRVQATINGSVYTDEMTLVQVTGGTNSVSGFLTNQSITLAAANDGTVVSYASATGTFKVYDGITDKTGASVTYSVVSQTNCTATINSSGVYSITAMTADTASAVLQAVYNGVTIPLTVNLAKSRTGSAGTPANQYATAYLYQWAASVPANPTGTSNYNWSTGANTGYVTNDGWSTAVPTNPGTANLNLFVAIIQIVATSGTTSSSVSYTNATVQAWTKNGATGPQGASGVQSATATVYQWAASIPASPSGTATYTWSGGAISSIPSGWSATAGTSPTPGMTLWAAKVYLTDAATVTQTSFTWTSSSVSSVGYAGSTGQQGASYVTAYCASSTATTTTAPAQTTGKTSLPATNDGGITGTWSSAVPSLTSGQYLYQSDGIYDPTTDKVTWSIPYWSSLKVGSLNAITTNTGNLTVSGTISSANGNFSVDAGGGVTMKSATIQDGSGNIILQAGVALSSQTSQVSTAINSAATTAIWNSVTGTGRPEDNANFTSPSKGSALNDDPNLENPNSWNIVGPNISIAATGGLGGGSGTKFFTCSSGTDQKVRAVRAVAVDAAKTYNLNALLFAATSANNRNIYLFVDFYDYQGTWLSTSWGGSQSGYTFGGLPATTWTRYGDYFGANTSKPIPSDARTMVIGVWFQYASGTSAVGQGAMDIRLEEATSIYSISADNVLSKGEKSALIKEWNTIDAESYDLDAKADSLTVSRTDYDNKKAALSTYLLGLSPAWNNTAVDTAIDGPTFRSKFTDYYTAKQALVNALAATAAATATWSGVTGSGKPADNATVGATLGTNVNGQITSFNSSTLIANQAINSVHISDLRTTNYAEDGSGNPTAGAKLSSTGTALKVEKNSFQIGTLVLNDYWFRLVQGIDGSVTSNRIIWRGNNDATTRGGAPDINCLSITPKMSIIEYYTSDNTQTNIGGLPGSGTGMHSVFYGFALTPTSYSSNTDNLDAMQQIHVQFFAKPNDTSPFTEIYQSCPSRTYSGSTGADGVSRGSFTTSFLFDGNALWYSPTPPSANPNLSGQSPNILHGSVGAGGTYGVYCGYLRVRVANTYGWSASKDFGPTTSTAGASTSSTTTTYKNNIICPGGTITGVAGSSGGGSGASGGACPAPWVKVRLLNGKEINAADLHNGARLAAVNDNNMQVLPQGGTVRDLTTIWAQRYRVKLTNGAATEWSENHRFAVAERGWVTVQNLRGGDQILGLEESIVESVLAVGEGQVVSFRVEGAGTYFAGGLLCHNTKASF
jgi:hypothetical protein